MSFPVPVAPARPFISAADTVAAEGETLEAIGAGLRNAAELEASARSALESAPVRRAAEREHWLELPIMVPETGHTVEGIIDLMYREDDGSLVVADRPISA